MSRRRKGRRVTFPISLVRSQNSIEQIEFDPSQYTVGEELSIDRLAIPHWVDRAHQSMYTGILTGGIMVSLVSLVSLRHRGVLVASWCFGGIMVPPWYRYISRMP